MLVPDGVQFVVRSVLQGDQGVVSTRGGQDELTSHFPGYQLKHNGDDPVSGWQMLYAGQQDSH